MQEGNVAVAFLYKKANSGDTTEIFHHVTHNAIDCGCKKNMQKTSTVPNYAEIHMSYFLVCIQTVDNS